MWQGRRVPANTAELLALLDLTRFGEMSFVAPHPRTRMQRTYGGQVLAQALTAAYQTVPHDRVAHSLLPSRGRCRR